MANMPVIPSSSTFSELNVDYIVYRGQVNMSIFEAHPYYEILYLFSGQRTMYMYNTKFSLTPSNIIIIPPGIPHKTISASMTEQARICLMIDPSFFEKLIPDSADALADILTSIPLVLDLSSSEQETVSTQLKDIRDLFYTTDDLLMKPLKKQAAVLHLFMTLFQKIEALYSARSPSERNALLHNDRLFNDIIAYLQSNYRQNITLDDISAQFHLCKRRVSSLLNQYLGSSWIDYVNCLRIKDAIFCMTHSHCNISEIAASVGFGTLTHFERVFKSTLGMTPTQYIRKLKKATQECQY